MPVTDYILQKFNNIEYYIETGTDHGVSLGQAIQAGYKNIYTIDVVECADAREKYDKVPGVSFIMGDSTKVMWDLIKDINQQIVFYLDAHYFGADASVNLPLFNEIDVIGRHHLKNHIIIVDDVRLFESEMHINRHDVSERLLKINPEYKIILVDDNICPRDVLLCSV